MIHCVFPGSFKDAHLKALTMDFHKRLDRLWPVAIEEILETERSILKFLEKEKGKGILVSMDAHGKKVDSAEFGKWVTGESKDVYFFVWGASGPRPEWSAFMDRSISLSPMTTSHEIARVFLMEQLYRAGTVLRGHPYAK